MTNVDNPIITPTLLSTCTGMRGLERGVDRALRKLRYIFGVQSEIEGGSPPFKTIADVEIEAFVAWNLVAQMEQGVLAPAPVWTDLKTFPWADFHGKISILTGGYPCQPFSSAGQQHGVLDPRHLFPFLEKGIGAVRPVLCWFENVANHLNLGYEEVRGRLHKLGYTVEEGIFSAQQVGAPHLRKRLFIMAVANTYCSEQSKRRGDLAKVLGLQKVERESEYGSAVFSGDGSAVGYANSEGQQQSEGDQREIRRRTSDAGEVVEDTSGLGDGGRSDGNQRWKGWPLQTSGSSAQLDDSERAGLERQYRHGSLKTRWQEQVRSVAAASFWPAGQGEYQHEWEEPRLESSVGYEIDGYGFVEDLLRLGGNAVVEQQSEIAFLTLFQKFL